MLSCIQDPEKRKRKGGRVGKEFSRQISGKEQSRQREQQINTLHMNTTPGVFTEEARTTLIRDKEKNKYTMKTRKQYN